MPLSRMFQLYRWRCVYIVYFSIISNDIAVWTYFWQEWRAVTIYIQIFIIWPH